MKTITAIVLCLCLLAGCAAGGEALELKSGSYFLKADTDRLITPYLYLDMENQSAHLSGSMVMSYAETGTVTIEGSRVMVQTGQTTYVLRMQDSETLILTDCSGENPFHLPVGGELVFNEEWS